MSAPYSPQPTSTTSTPQPYLMNSPAIIEIPPRIIRPSYTRPGTPVPVEPTFGGEDELRLLARQIVEHDPALALLLARAGGRVRSS